MSPQIPLFESNSVMEAETQTGRRRLLWTSEPPK